MVEWTEQQNVDAGENKSLYIFLEIINYFPCICNSGNYRFKNMYWNIFEETNKFIGILMSRH